MCCCFVLHLVGLGDAPKLLCSCSWVQRGADKMLSTCMLDSLKYFVRIGNMLAGSIPT